MKNKEYCCYSDECYKRECKLKHPPNYNLIKNIIDFKKTRSNTEVNDVSLYKEQLNIELNNLNIYIGTSIERIKYILKNIDKSNKFVLIEKLKNLNELYSLSYMITDNLLNN